MPSNLDVFYFDVNYDFSIDSVFTLVDKISIAPFPKIIGNFLLLDNTDFLLLDGENLTLL